jgi:hypothetical protein
VLTDDRRFTASDTVRDVFDGVGKHDASVAADAVCRIAQPARVPTDQHERVLSRRQFRCDRAAAAPIRAEDPDLVGCAHARVVAAGIAK